MGLERRRPGSMRGFDRGRVWQAMAGGLNAHPPDALAQQLRCNGGIGHWRRPRCAEGHISADRGAGCEGPVGTHVQVPLVLSVGPHAEACP